MPDDGSTPSSEPAQPGQPVQSVQSSPRVRPVRPEQAREDTDAAWGDYPEPDEQRLYRDRPPHWADF